MEELLSVTLWNAEGAQGKSVCVKEISTVARKALHPILMTEG
jgi:hypothetical protein